MNPRIPAWHYALLIAPFGAVTGFGSVVLALHLSHAGVGAEALSALVALSLLPHTFKFLWAPLVDLTGTRRHWCWMSTCLTGLGLAAVGWLGQDGRQMGALTLAVLGVNLASTFSGMAVESLMAHHTKDAERGRVGGWFQAGNLGGMGLGGGAAMGLMQSLGLNLFHAAAVLGAAFVLCCWPLLSMPEPEPEPDLQAHSWVGHVRNLGRDLGSVSRSHAGILAMLVCFLPIGAGAVTNLWPGMATQWQVSDGTMALVNGTLGGLASAVGCLFGGWVCDRLPRRTAYCLFGVLQAALSVAMALLPATEFGFAFFVLAFSAALGMTYAAFSSLTLEAIGGGAAATKYNLLASLSNAPTAYMTYVNGWVQGQYGVKPMLVGDALFGLLGLALFVLAAHSLRRKFPPLHAD